MNAAAELHPALNLDVSDLIADAIKGNRVTATVFRSCRAPDGRRYTKRVLHEMGPEGAAQAPMLTLADHARILKGEKPVYLEEVLRRMGGKLVGVTPNLRTTVGINFCAANLWGTDGGQVAVADWIALSNNTSAPAAGDSSATLPWSTAQATDGAASGTRGEYTALGMARAAATLAHTAGATSLTASHTWTCTATCTNMQMAGLFGGAGKNAQGSGATNILFLENTFTPTTLNFTGGVGDQLSLTWTINF